MAIAAGCIWEVRGATGNDNNGGGFVSGLGGTDRSQQNSAQVNIDNSAITTSITGSTVTFTGGTYTPTAADVGNIVQFLSGTNVLTASTSQSGFYEITGFTATTWTLDRTPLSSGTTTNATAKMGGALASPGAALNGATASNTVYVLNSGTQQSPTVYSLAWLANSGTQPNNVPGSRLHILVGGSFNNNTPFHLIGYATNRTLTNSDAPPEFDVGNSFAGNAGQMIFADSNYIRIRNFKFRNPNSVSGVSSSMLNLNGVYALIERCDLDANSVASWYAVFLNGNFEYHFYDVAVQHVNAHYGFDGSSGASNSFTACYSTNNSGGGYQGGGRFVRCIAANNSGSGSDGFNTSSTPGSSYINCDSYNNGRHGFVNYYDTATDGCIAWGNAGHNWASVSNCPITTLYNCAGGGSGLSNIDQTVGAIPSYALYNFQTLTADPFTNGAGGDFSLNNTAGGGALCRGNGYPASIYTTATTGGGLDIGVWQHVVAAVIGLILIPTMAFSADASLPVMQQQGVSFVAHGGVFGQPPPPPPPAPSHLYRQLASQAVPPAAIFPEPGTAYCNGGWYTPDLFTLISSLLTPNSGRFCFIPEDLLCPIDQYYSIIVSFFVTGGGWNQMSWQCSNDPTHGGPLPINPSLVPVPVQGNWTGGLDLKIDPSSVVAPGPAPLLPPNAPPLLVPNPNIDTSAITPDSQNQEIAESGIEEPFTGTGKETPPITKIGGGW